MVNLLKPTRSRRLQRLVHSTISTTAVLVLGAALSGCHSPRYNELGMKPEQAAPLVLHEGDSVQITFAGSPALNTTQQIRRDGRISLTQVGEYKAAGLTPEELQKALLQLYDAQLQTKEVTVTVQSAAFPVYVMGAVLKPGKIMFDRPTTALQAIMEAGGFDPSRANSKGVVVLRSENGRTDRYTLNLKNALKSGETKTFDLHPSDILIVPEKFVWF